jgi:TRAP-type C4-dicarboxylate transport system permease small subunit
MLPRFFVRLLEWMLIGLLTTMVVLVFGNVVLRYGFNSGLTFSEEISRFVFMWLTLLGALLAMHEHAHLGMTSVISAMPVAVRRVMRFASDLLMLACCGLLAQGTWKQVRIAMDDHSPVTEIPMGLVFSALLVCSTGICWILLHSLWRQISGRMPAEELVVEPAGSVE